MPVVEVSTGASVGTSRVRRATTVWVVTAITNAPFHPSIEVSGKFIDWRSAHAAFLAAYPPRNGPQTGSHQTPTFGTTHPAAPPRRQKPLGGERTTACDRRGRGCKRGAQQA